MTVNDDQSRALVVGHISQDFSGLELRVRSAMRPGPSELLIRVHSAALNFPDVLMAQGKYQFKPDPPFVPGLEAAGEVVEVGPDVKEIKPGAAVVVMTRQGGALSELMTVDLSQVRPMPEGLSWDEGAGYFTAGVTAYVSLVERARLKPGETLLVNGASGGTGLAAVQLGLHLGAKVIATGRSAGKLEAVKSVGAHHVLQTGTDLRDEILRLTDGNGVDVVFDPVGGDVFDASIRALAWGGRLLVVGFVGGRIAEVKSNYVLIKNISVIGVRAGETVRRDPVEGEKIAMAVDALASAGVLKPKILHRFPFEESVQAFRMLANGEIMGKVVISM